MIGWWSFLGSDRITEIYYEMAKKFPLSENVIQVYVGPNTTRQRHELVKSPECYYNGIIELIIRLAGKF